MSKTFDGAISAFGASAKSQFNSPSIRGRPEEQLRQPVTVLLRDLAEIDGLPPNAVQLIGETHVAELKSRPDFAVTVNKALVGFIEIKAPGKGADPRKFEKEGHDAKQWDKLKSLPNLIYTDGNAFSLWHDGELDGKIIHLDGDIESSGAKLKAPETLRAVISGFLQWKPQAPKSAKQLAQVSARLCRLLREEVVEQMALGNEGLTGLANGSVDFVGIVLQASRNGNETSFGYMQVTGAFQAGKQNVVTNKGCTIFSFSPSPGNNKPAVRLDNWLSDDSVRVQIWVK